jgi:hypothetical protein
MVLSDRENAVALCDDLAARDLRSIRDRLIEVLVRDPLRDEHRRLVSLLGGLEETERAEDAAAALDQEVAGETRELTELRDERLVDLADDLMGAGRVDTFVAPNGGMHGCDAPSVSPTGQRTRLGTLRRQARGHSRRGKFNSLGGFNS